MAKYTDKFRYQATERALKQGINPTARELKISRNVLKTWIKVYKKGKVDYFPQYCRPHNRTATETEKSVVNLKERKPEITLKEIQKIIKKEKAEFLSINGIHKILVRYGMSGKGFPPFIGQNTIEIQRGMRTAYILIEQGHIKKASRILNSLPTLQDFSILKKVPSQFLSPRRQAEQLEALLGILPMEQIYKKAKELRRQCEKEKLFFTGTFVTTIEIDALTFLGYPTKVFTLYKKYRKYLPGLPLSLKYMFLSECFVSYMDTPEKYPKGIFKNFPYNLERFCSKLPEGDQRIQWYDNMSVYFEIIGEIDKSLKWMKKLLLEMSPEDKKRYLSKYFFLLSTKGAYSEVLKFNESFEDIPVPLFLIVTLAQGNALLGTGNPEKALEIALNAFFKAEKEHLLPIMAGFTFFIACCYSVLKETKKRKRYLKMSLYFSKKTKRVKKLYSLLLGITPFISYYSKDAWTHLVSLYLSASKTLRKKDYLKAYRFAEKKGLIGFFHRIILLYPEVINNLIRKGKETYLHKEFLNLTIFKEIVPIYKLHLLTDKESIFYGDRKINISHRSKDFHLLIYLFVNRKKNLDKERLYQIFYKNTSRPSQCLIKALSRIRGRLGLSKGALILRKAGVFFDIEAKIDLEEFEERYKMGRISEKVGEVGHTLKEYQECFVLYKKSPFERMGYYYNFAEERRMLVRNMYEYVCQALIKNAKEKKDVKMAMAIKKKQKKSHSG